VTSRIIYSTVILSECTLRSAVYLFRTCFENTVYFIL
jgi:hypothetical protein